MISYSGLINYGKATLPSVETWGTDMNILRDPPRSITTRKTNKVGQTSDIVEMIDEAHDRASENILQFPRGINPSTSVSSKNYGTNGGQSHMPSGNPNSLNAAGGKQAYGPYVIMKDGAFRPPLYRQENLTPLSRLPRVWTTAFTKPGFTDFSKKMKTCGTAENTREVKNSLLKTKVVPNAYYKIEKPIEAPNEVKYYIQDIVNSPYNSNMYGGDQTIQYVQEPSAGLQDMNNVFNVESNMNDSSYYVQNTNEVDTERYLQDPNNQSVFSNNSGKNVSFLDENADISNRQTKELYNINYKTPLTTTEQKNNYIHDDIELYKNIPNYQSGTNLSSGQNHSEYIHDNIELDRNIPTYQYNTNLKSSKHENYIHEDIDLSKNLPVYRASTNAVGKNTKISYIHDDVELYRNLPVYNTVTNNSGHKDVTYIHDDIELEKNLPEHYAHTNNNGDKRMNLQHEYMKPLENNISSMVGNIQPNQRILGDVNKSATEYYGLNEKLSYGSFQNQGNIPSQDRMQNIVYKNDPVKAQFKQAIVNNYDGRF